MFGVISVLLYSGMEIILTKKINDMIEEVSEEVLEKKKVKYMEEYPSQLILMGISRQSKIFQNNSKVWPKNSETMKVQFSELVLKKDKKVITLRGRLESKYYSWIAEWIEIAGAVVEEEICPEIDLCYIKDQDDLDRVYKKLVNNFKSFQLETLVDDVRIYENVESDRYENIILPVTGDIWRVFTVETITYLVGEHQKEELMARIQHTNSECYRECCVDERGDLIPTEELRKNIAQRMELPLHFKKYSVSRDHYFNDRRMFNRVQEYMDGSRRRWKDIEVRGQNYGKEWKKKNEQGFRILQKGPNQKEPWISSEEGRETQREREIRERKKAREKTEEEPNLNRRTIEIGKKNTTAREGLSYKNKKDLEWSPLGKRQEETDEEYEEEDSETMEELREEARLLEEDLKVPLEELVMDMGLQVKGLRRTALANNLVELWSKYQKGDIVNPSDFMEEMSKVKMKLDRQYGAPSEEDDEDHGLTSKPASQGSSSGNLVSNEEEYVKTMASKIDNMVIQRKGQKGKDTNKDANKKKREEINLSESTTTTNSTTSEEKENDKKDETVVEVRDEEESGRLSGLSAWIPTIRLPGSRAQSETGDKSDK